MRPIDDLVMAFLDEELSEEEVRQLFLWVSETPENAEEFARISSLHSQLRSQLAGERQAEESASLKIVTRPRPRERRPGSIPSRKKLRPEWIALGVTLLLMITLTVVVWMASPSPVADESPTNKSRKSTTGQPDTMPRVAVDTPSSLNSESPETFASIVQLVDVKWSGQESHGIDDRIGAQWLRLEKGIARLLFDDGVEVTLEGPAEYEVLDHGQTRLGTGILTATVPPGAEGFEVATPEARVIDLGTAFGIQLSDDGTANVSVFDGEVEVVSLENDEIQRLTEGESARLQAGGRIERVDFATSCYRRVWPVSSGISSATGAFRVAPPRPGRLDLIQGNHEIFVVPECLVTTLDAPLDINISMPGKHFAMEHLTPGQIGAGTRVRSYLLQFNPDQNLDDDRLERVVGSITFDRPVVGLILLEEQLEASDNRFALHGRIFDQTNRELEFTPDDTGDRVRLSKDQRTVYVDLLAMAATSDHIRVIVEDPLTDAQDWHQIRREMMARRAMRHHPGRPTPGQRFRGKFGKPPYPGMGRGPGGPSGGPAAMLDRLMARDANGDGMLAEDELPSKAQFLFARGDTNKDGLLTKEEILAMRPGPPPEHNDDRHGRFESHQDHKRSDQPPGFRSSDSTSN